MKNDAALAAEARRLLSRAIALVPDDHSVAVDLGNSYLDLGYSGKDAASFQKARELFINALAAKPGDDAARTDLALSYLLDVSPDFHRAEEEFQRALKTDPKQERALQFLTVCYLQQGKFGDAAKMLDRLKAANPGNEKIAELMAQITAKQAAPIR
jgi:Tfp pilus assembly protein PilF